MSEKMPLMPAPPKELIGPRINHSSRLLRQRFNKVVNDAGLFSGQQHIILLLSENGGLTVSQISSALEITPATVSVSIKRMERAGFVYRQADEKDARISKIFLSDKGAAALQSIKDKMDAQESIIEKGMTKEEKEMLSNLLDRVISNLEEKEMMGDA
jgi:DNA-binding MarR family transcriptional regulator